MNKKTKRGKNVRKSMKGEWGKVGAPPKKTKFPTRPFTLERLFDMNSTGPNAQCPLSLRNKVLAARTEKNGTGTIFELVGQKQAHGAVGRPMSRWVLKANYDAATMTLAPDKVKKARKPKVVVQTVAVNPATPAVAPVEVHESEAVPALPAPATPAPVQEETAGAPMPVTDYGRFQPVVHQSVSEPVSTLFSSDTSAAPAPSSASPEPAIG
jgi:hypothetical protein